MRIRPNPLWEDWAKCQALLIYSWFLIPSRMANPILALTGQHSRSQTAVPPDWTQQHARASFPALYLSVPEVCGGLVQVCSTVFTKTEVTSTSILSTRRIILTAVWVLLMLACVHSYLSYLHNGTKWCFTVVLQATELDCVPTAGKMWIFRHTGANFEEFPLTIIEHVNNQWLLYHWRYEHDSMQINRHKIQVI